MGALPQRQRRKRRALERRAGADWRFQLAREAERLMEGDVLVAPSTDPGWTPLFLRASALVMETGGYLSHGAIVAREFGIPAVANVPGILAALKDGETIRVDGSAGRVARERTEEPEG